MAPSRTTPRTRAAAPAEGRGARRSARGAPGRGVVATWKSGILGTCEAASRGRFPDFQDFRFSPYITATRTTLRRFSSAITDTPDPRVPHTGIEYYVTVPAGSSACQSEPFSPDLSRALIQAQPEKRGMPQA